MKEKNKPMSCIRLQADEQQIAACKQTVSELEASFSQLANALSLAGNSVRLKILFLLQRESKLCVCDLSDILDMSISAISQHLRKLRDRQLIRPERKGQTIFYSLTPEYEELFAPFFEQIENNVVYF